MNVYYRVFKTTYGNIEKSIMNYFNENNQPYKRAAGYKIKGTIDEALSLFEDHCKIERENLRSKNLIPKSQFLLLELGTDSDYNIVAVTTVDGEVINLK